MSNTQRMKDLESDLVESEGRVMELLADLKKELRRLSDTQELHSEILTRLLSRHPIFDPEKELLTKKLEGTSCDCG